MRGTSILVGQLIVLITAKSGVWISNPDRIFRAVINWTGINYVITQCNDNFSWIKLPIFSIDTRLAKTQEQTEIL